MYAGKLPVEYLNFMEENPEGYNLILTSKLEEIVLFGESDLVENIEMTGVGSAKNFECLKLFIRFQREIGYADTDDVLSELEMKNVENGFVIGGDYDGYLYLDHSDDHSVWIYFPENGQIQKIADSFLDLITNK